MSPYTWIHISDWHQKTKDWDRTVVADGLLVDIRSRHSISPDLGKVHALYFTGDLSHSGSSDEFTLAATQFLDPIREELGLPSDRVFIIPGNHDISRNQFRRLPGDLQKPLKSAGEVNIWFSEDADRQELQKPFNAYNSFVRGYGAAGFGALGHIVTVQHEGLRIGILGVNSALLCGRAIDSDGQVQDRGSLVVGEPQIHDGLRQLSNHDVRIALIHHPFDWLADFDRELIEARLLREVHFVLRGHVHKPGIVTLTEPNGSCVLIPAGAAFDQRVPSDERYANSYNYVSLDPKSGQCDIYLRRLGSDHTRWREDVDAAPNGRFTFKIPLAGDASRKVVGTADDIVAAEKAYLRFIRNRCAYVDPRGISQTVTSVTLPLNQVFVSLHAVRDVSGAMVFDPHGDDP